VAQAVPGPVPAAVHVAQAVPGPVPAAVRVAQAVPGPVPAAVHVAQAVARPGRPAHSAVRVVPSRPAAAGRSGLPRRGYRYAPDLRLVHADRHGEHPRGHLPVLLSALLLSEEEDREPLPAGVR
jgi:hypothetical protein